MGFNVNSSERMRDDRRMKPENDYCFIFGKPVFFCEVMVATLLARTYLGRIWVQGESARESKECSEMVKLQVHMALIV